ncbi:ClpX C4-type zinc finger protein [Pectobacterium versatile]|uniref:ClpX C4-type zinc finger protein n=1 Tax=Pectobacterium versatile TaxID=2488639 RepID=UPI001F184EC8|nr:ClpX C4-type zinc finger protein [Pectobacterium versatile]
MKLPVGKEVPKYTKNDLKLMGISSRLQALMVNENITACELVGCAESVRYGYHAVRSGGLSAVNGEYECSFCGTPRLYAKKIIVGKGNVCICDRCVEHALGVLKPDAEGK